MIDVAERAALLDEVRSVCVRAGETILAIARSGAWSARAKADASPLTQADVAANHVILDALATLTPGTAIVSEETACELASLPERYWLVDPLDGTREFVAGSAEYTVNVALVERGVPVLGVVHAPALRLSYAAARGCGAQRGGDGASETIRARPDPFESVVVSRSHPSHALDAFLAALPAHRLLEVGSSLKLCYVADGSAQLYARLGPTCAWDTAAAHAIVLEAGGDVFALDGRPLRYDRLELRNPEFVCTAVARDVWEPAARTAR